MPRTNELVEVAKRATTQLRRVRTGPEAERTDALRATAEAFVDARAFFYTRDAEIDWRGSTHAYRRWVREIFEKAGIPREQAASLQAAVRYHAGNILRDRLDSETLASIGLLAESPRERAAEKRERTSEASVLFLGGGPIEGYESLSAVVATIESALMRAQLADGLAPEERAELAKSLRRVCELAEERRSEASQ